MDNLTHALAGAAIAECALPRPARPDTRRVFMVAGAVAANAPDLDLVYTWITEAPLGYLLHHRGHTHTWPGLLVLGALVLLVVRYWPAARAAIGASYGRFSAVVAVALTSHLLLDTANSYGTHLLYPMTSRWYYGDAVFIFEPWVWLVLGAAAALNAKQTWTQRLVWALVAAMPLVLLVAGLISTGVVVALAVGLAVVTAALRGLQSHVRAGVAMGLTVVMFTAMGVVSGVVKDAVRVALPSGEGLVDIVANPNPAVPWCWAVVTIERDGDAALVVRRGTVSLVPAVTAAEQCVSHRLMLEASASASAARAGDYSRSAAVQWNREWRVDVKELTALSADCRVAAWLQFGRVPFVDNGVIVDLRFDNPLRNNFSAMDLERVGTRGCPSNVTDWTWPRADVLMR